MIKLCKKCQKEFESTGNQNICRKFECFSKQRWYDDVHRWLRNTFGKADKCEGLNCNKKSERYVWAKKKSVKYIKNRANFFMLCFSCHTNYDMNNEWRERLKYARKKGQNLVTNTL